MEELIDRILTFMSDLPIGLIIFLAAIAFSFFGGDKKKATDQPDRIPPQDEAPRPSMPTDTGWGSHGARPASSNMTGRRQEQGGGSGGGFTFASDERRAQEKRERRKEEVLVFGGLDFGSRGSLFREGEGDDRDSQWGKTKYGFDDAEWGSESQWGSSFGEKKNSEPIIR